VRWRGALRAGVRGELEPDPAGIAPDDRGDELLGVGFRPLLALRVTEPSPRERSVVLLDPPATTVAVVFQRPGVTERPVVFLSAFGGGAALVTTGRLVFPPESPVLAQCFAGAPVEALLTEHRAALAWLAAHDHRPVPLDAPSAAALLTAQRRQTRDRVLALPWSACVGLWWMAFRRRTHCGGPLRDQPDIAGRLASWGDTTPAPS
jgi:hypothetical protein